MVLPRLLRRLRAEVHTFSLGGRRFALDVRHLALSEIRHRVKPWAWRNETTPISLADRPSHEAGAASVQARMNGGGRRVYCFLNICHTCDLRCRYCFAHGGDYGGRAEIMDASVARQSVDWLIDTSPAASELVINFFGGEPLLAMPVLTDTLEYASTICRARGQAFSAIVSTNGTTDLTSLGKALEGVSHEIAISIDGPESVHDSNRPFRDGTGSFAVVTRNCASYLERYGPSRVTARATWRPGQANLARSVEAIHDVGFRRIYIGRETTVRGAAIDLHPGGMAAHFDELYAAYDGLARWYVDQLDSGRSFVVNPVHALMKAILESRPTRFPCTAGIDKWCVTPEGWVYPCHRHVDAMAKPIGSVSSPVAHPREERAAGSRRPAKCDRCWARYWCESENCTYLSDMGCPLSSRPGFCEHSRRFLEMVCLHVGELSATGRSCLLQAEQTVRTSQPGGPAARRDP